MALILLLVVVHPTMFYSSIPQVLTLPANSKYMMMIMIMNMRINFATKNCSAKLILHALNDYLEYQMNPWKMSVRSQFTHCSLPYGTWRSGSLAIAAVDFTKLSPKIPESPLSLMLVKIIPLALPLLQAPSHPTTNFSNKTKSSKRALRDGVVFHLKPSRDFGIEEKNI